MAQRDDFSDFWGDDDTAPVVDTRADGRLYRVPLGRLSPNLVNPRTDFGTEDQLIDFGKSLARRQNQPCPVVSRGAYLKLWPDHSNKVGDVDYVLVSGERRYRAATAVAHPVLDCVVNDDFAADRKTFMEAVVSENVDRQNFDPVEEAYAVQALVTEFGSNRAVAQHFERADGWVTQRILLTNLAREVQDLVRTKAMPLDAARSLGKLARDNDWSTRDQLEWWETEQEKRTAASAARSAARKAARQQSPAVSSPAPTDPAVSTIHEPTPTGEAALSFTAVKQKPVKTRPAVHHTSSPEPSAAPAATAVNAAPIPEPRAVQPEPEQAAPPVADDQVKAPRRFPYDEPVEAVLLCHKNMAADDFVRAGEAWLRVLREQHPDAYKQLINAQ
ncbi:ParB/RepB/Spo0J family partition protein [Streptomyces tendae]|uniref:ParB/RepB/Spo0J family partition protein n=1 Tax=Streptomyces tendae TaxID=1932 RepID=UPI0037FAE78A